MKKYVIIFLTLLTLNACSNQDKTTYEQVNETDIQNQLVFSENDIAKAIELNNSCNSYMHKLNNDVLPLLKQLKAEKPDSFNNYVSFFLEFESDLSHFPNPTNNQYQQPNPYLEQATTENFSLSGKYNTFNINGNINSDDEFVNKIDNTIHEQLLNKNYYFQTNNNENNGTYRHWFYYHKYNSAQRFYYPAIATDIPFYCLKETQENFYKALDLDSLTVNSEIHSAKYEFINKDSLFISKEIDSIEEDE